jgi:hypothetical protein
VSPSVDGFDNGSRRRPRAWFTSTIGAACEFCVELDRVAGDRLDLQNDELGRLERGEPDEDVHDPFVDVV